MAMTSRERFLKVLSGEIPIVYLLHSVDFLEYGTPIQNVEAYVKTGL
jgi:hypothetical protein